MAAPACECLHKLYSRQYSAADLSRVKLASMGCLLSNTRPIEEERLDPQHNIHAVNTFTLVLLWNAVSMAASLIGPMAQMQFWKVVGGGVVTCAALVPILSLASIGEMGNPFVILYGIVAVPLLTALCTLLVANSKSTDGELVDPTMTVVHAQTTIYWAQYCAVLSIAFICCNAAVGRFDATYHWVSVLFAAAIGTAAAGACLLNMVREKKSWIPSVAALACLVAPMVLYSLPFANTQQLNTSSRSTTLHADTSVWYATLLLLLVPQLEHQHRLSDLQIIRAQGYRAALETTARIIVTVAAAMDLYALPTA